MAMEKPVSHPQPNRRPPRILIFPLPEQGHVNPMLKLAELLALAGLHVTFLTTPFIHNRLIRHTDIKARFASYPGFLLKTISDGLPDDHPRSGEKKMDHFISLHMVTKRLLKHMLASHQLGSDLSPSVSCIIADGTFAGFTTDIATELQIPILHFHSFSACGFWASYSILNLIETRELPIQDMDKLVTGVPGMESFLRFRDLPSVCRASNTKDPSLQGIARETRHITRGQGLILNTFEELEGPLLSLVRTKYPNMYSIAPIHTHLKLKLKHANKEVSSQSSNSLFEIDRNCMAWLDAQPLNSVIYVSFGSTTVMTNDQLMEFWYGLVNSKKRFLWAIRHDLVHKQGDDDDGKNNIPAELTEGTNERGYVVGWAPQEEVLEHPSVRGFLTHSGMNSILESIVAGVPMLCWPYHADQQVISRCVSEVWKIGLDMKDVCDRNIVEKMVNGIMVERREEFRRAVDEYSRLAIKSVSQGGSSYTNLDRLIQDIHKMNDELPT